MKLSNRPPMKSLIGLAMAGTLATEGGMIAIAELSASCFSAIGVSNASSDQQIPQQPLADPETGKPIKTRQPRNEPVWTRTCDRGQGLEIWNSQLGVDCAGTLTFYYYNVAKGSVNMAAFLASQGGRTGDWNTLMKPLDDWCSAHAFQCTVLVGAAYVGLALVLGPIHGQESL